MNFYWWLLGASLTFLLCIFIIAVMTGADDEQWDDVPLELYVLSFILGIVWPISWFLFALSAGLALPVCLTFMLGRWVGSWGGEIKKA